MATTPSRFPMVNPKLNTYYAIFTSLMLSILLVLAVLEQIGWSKLGIGQMAFIAFSAVILILGLASTNSKSLDFFASGRRVPAGYNGLAIVASSLGGAGLLGFTGCVFLIGFDALAIGIGWCAGLLLLGTLFAPYLRKMGAYTVPGFLFQRYNNSQAVRYICILATLIPVGLILIAEIQIAAFAVSLVFEQSSKILTLAILLFVGSIVACGGMRSLTWSQCAQFIIVIIGFLSSLIVYSILKTNLPLPQLTYGRVLDELTLLEKSSGVVSGQNSLTAIPTQIPTLIQKPFLESFSILSSFEFIAIAFCFMAGVASLPGLLMRMSTTPSVFEARKSCAWALAITGFIFISIPAYAVFTKTALFQTLPQYALDQLPQWVIDFQNKGIFSFENTDKLNLDMSNLAVARDGILTILPHAASFPYIFVILIICSAFFAATASAGIQVLCLTNMLSHDLIFRSFTTRMSEKNQINISRIMTFAIVFVFGWISVSMEFDTFKLLSIALSISASSLFPALCLAIWWKNSNDVGVVLGILAGVLSTVTVIWLSEQGMPLLGISTYSSAIVGLPISFLVMIIVSKLRSSQLIVTRSDIVNDFRFPGGETIYDRVMRTLMKKQQKAIALKQN